MQYIHVEHDLGLMILNSTGLLPQRSRSCREMLKRCKLLSIEQNWFKLTSNKRRLSTVDNFSHYVNTNRIISGQLQSLLSQVP
ncbi:hypothetical protein KUTeg_013896 [Tegillarca granosa]|uniref:Uncharacterized protein n=1 Tax=Tegillarca granosa TaxID=220873 RepID=A0ABQ9EV10_TEGGR|nr:hypothetical protein KUTeg_013896 [Tegillarca granosa]